MSDDESITSGSIASGADVKDIQTNKSKRPSKKRRDRMKRQQENDKSTVDNDQSRLPNYNQDTNTETGGKKADSEFSVLPASVLFFSLPVSDWTLVFPLLLFPCCEEFPVLPASVLFFNKDRDGMSHTNNDDKSNKDNDNKSNKDNDNKGNNKKSNKDNDNKSESKIDQKGATSSQHGNNEKGKTKVQIYLSVYL
jgi:hypothetical protein